MNRRTYASASLREKTRAALIKSLRPIAAINANDEDDAYADAPNEYRYDNSDGVECRTPEELQLEQQDKKDRLRKQSRAMFSPGEQVSESGSDALDINHKGKWGYTALHFAAIVGDEAECDRLIAAGADLSIMENGGKMAWQKAESKGHDALALKLMPQPQVA